MLVIGGKTIARKDNTFQLYSLHLAHLSWHKVDSIGLIPSSRSFFSLASLDDNQVVLFGGKCNTSNNYLNDTYLFKKQQRYWENPFVAGQAPEPRYHHQACNSQHSHQNTIYILGGLNDAFLKMELQQLTLTKQSHQDWTKIQHQHSKVEYVCQVADNTIYDNKKHLCDLEITILDEKTNINYLKKKT